MSLPIGVFEKDSSPPTRLSHDALPTNSPSHNLLQSLQAELRRHQETISSLKSERDAMGKELDHRKDIETSGFIIEYLLLVLRMTNGFSGLELKDVQDELRRESANGTSLIQSVQQLESKLRSATSKAEELDGSLAGSRSE